MDWNILDGFIKIIFPGLLGFYFGLKMKRPWIIAESFFRTDKKTGLILKNVGQSTAKNIQIKEISINLQDTFFKPFEMMKGKAIFRFERLDYLEANGSTKEIGCKVFLDDNKESDSARALLSGYLQKGRRLNISYNDSYGLRCSTEFILQKNMIITQ